MDSGKCYVCFRLITIGLSTRQPNKYRMGMFMLKRIIGFLLFIGMTLVVFADDNVSASSDTDVNFNSGDGFEDPETGEWIQPFRVLKDGTVELVSEEEYLEMGSTDILSLEDPTFSYDSNSNLIEPNNTFFWRFKRSGNRIKVKNSRIKASPTINCTTPTCKASISVGATTTNSFSTGVGAERNAIKANAGYTWSTSASSSSTFSYSLRKGDQGYIGFNPYHWKVIGTLEYWGGQGIGVIESKSAWGSYPVTLTNGQADGVYAFVYTKFGK